MLMVLLSSSRSLSPVQIKHKQMILKSNEDANLKAKSQMKILVVDDNKGITEALSFYLIPLVFPVLLPMMDKKHSKSLEIGRISISYCWI